MLLLEGPEVLSSGGGAGGFGKLGEVDGPSNAAAGLKIGGCLKNGAGLKEGGEKSGWNFGWSFGCFGCSMNSLGCTRAIGDDERTSSSVVVDIVLEIVEKFV